MSRLAFGSVTCAAWPRAIGVQLAVAAEECTSFLNELDGHGPQKESLVFCRITSEEKDKLIAEALVLTSMLRPHKSDVCQALTGRGIASCRTSTQMGGLTHTDPRERVCVVFVTEHSLPEQKERYRN